MILNILRMEYSKEVKKLLKDIKEKQEKLGKVRRRRVI